MEQKTDLKTDELIAQLEQEKNYVESYDPKITLKYPKINMPHPFFTTTNDFSHILFSFYRIKFTQDKKNKKKRIKTLKIMVENCIFAAAIIAKRQKKQ